MHWFILVASFWILIQILASWVCICPVDVVFLVNNMLQKFLIFSPVYIYLKTVCKWSSSLEIVHIYFNQLLVFKLNSRLIRENMYERYIDIDSKKTLVVHTYWYEFKDTKCSSFLMILYKCVFKWVSFCMPALLFQRCNLYVD